MKKINVLISTFFGNGYISKIPGTFTSLSTLVILYVLFELLNFKNLNYILILYSIIFFYSFYAVMDSETEFENKDPRQIVIDEVLGQSMPFLADHGISTHPESFAEYAFRIYFAVFLKSYSNLITT